MSAIKHVCKDLRVWSQEVRIHPPVPRRVECRTHIARSLRYFNGISTSLDTSPLSHVPEQGSYGCLDSLGYDNGEFGKSSGVGHDPDQFER